MRFLAAVELLLAIAAYTNPVLGQQGVSPNAQPVEPMMVNVTRPAYPPLALMANITGDVVLRLGIRKDGGVDSAVVVSGHPMLAPAALDSARQSQFTCAACVEEITPYSVTYSYQLASGPDWPCSESHQHSTLSPNRVTVVAEPRIIQIEFSSLKVRSAKCLYLWQCGSKWGGEDYYYFAVPSVKCLDLWNCGRQLREPFATCRRLHREVW